MFKTNLSTTSQQSIIIQIDEIITQWIELNRTEWVNKWMRDRNDHMDRKRWIVGLVVVGMVGCMNEKLYLRMLYNNVDGYIWVLCFFLLCFGEENC